MQYNINQGRPIVTAGRFFCYMPQTYNKRTAFYAKFLTLIDF